MIATMTSKGQLTIPKTIRERAGLREGIRVDVVMRADGSVQLKPMAKTVAEVCGMLHRKGMKPVSIEQMDAGIAKAVRQANR